MIKQKQKIVWLQSFSAGKYTVFLYLFEQGAEKYDRVEGVATKASKTNKESQP